MLCIRYNVFISVHLYVAFKKINYVKKTRTGQSGASFCGGMTEKNIPVAIASESKGMDRKLRFFDSCPKYTHDVKENSATLDESNAFFTAHQGEVARRVSYKTGIPLSKLNKAVLESMWGACQSEVAVHDNANNWCSIFTEEDAEIFEFTYDLESYYTKGYGRDISYQIASPLFSDMVASIDDIVANWGANDEGDVLPKARLRFAHAETVMPFLALLGFYEDKEKLTHMWDEAAILNRKWRTSNISSLATNVAFVLYMCDVNGTGYEEPFVEILHNENIKYMPKCWNRRLCLLKDFKNIYKKYLEFDWDEECKSSASGLSFNRFFIMIFAALATIFLAL